MAYYVLLSNFTVYFIESISWMNETKGKNICWTMPTYVKKSLIEVFLQLFLNSNFHELDHIELKICRKTQELRKFSTWNFYDNFLFFNKKILKAKDGRFLLVEHSLFGFWSNSAFILKNIFIFSIYSVIYFFDIYRIWKKSWRN